MKKNVVLIDYENVQNVDLRPLLDHEVLIKVFHNESQKFTSAFTHLALAFGKEKIELVKISGTGKNAADFHIAYFLGKLAKEPGGAAFHIISKDTGFKPLVNYVSKEEKVPCFQETAIADIPLLKPVAPAAVHRPVKDHYQAAIPRPVKDNYQLVVEFLSKKKVPKPKRKKALLHQILDFRKNRISESEAEEIIKKLIADKVIHCTGEAISYAKG